MDKLIEDLMPLILSILGTIASAFLVWAQVKLKTKWNIDIEAAKKALESIDREALHKASETAAKLAVAKGLVGQEAIDFIRKYVLTSTPDAVSNLKPTESVLTGIAESKLADRGLDVDLEKILAGVQLPK